ncbi:MAG: hypothetical protein COA45_11750 [Zetaproteobacteria bacterium]|nr:MAG: hypothetical protein COA45_11750 [Zetaproteobacteria bacterium]
MAKVGAQRAAILTGKSKSTIQRAMNSGKLSFELDQNKRRVIDVSELERVFGIKQQDTSAPEKIETKEIVDAVEKERMRMQIKMLEQQLLVSDERLTDLTDQRNKWEKQASQILITSQYSQKQAEELRAQIKEREDRARQRRLQNAQVQKAQAKTFKGSKAPRATSYEAKKLNEKMKKLKAENENASDYSSSVFRFWKRAKS